MPWVQSMVVILILPPLHHFMMYTKITKASSPKTAFLHAYFLFNFAMPSLDGKVLPLMLEYGMMPEGKYYLADAGYPTCNQLLVPYRSVHYHLAEWGRANVWYICGLFLDKMQNNQSNIHPTALLI